MEPIEIDIKEKSYFFLRVVISLLFYGGLALWLYQVPQLLSLVIGMMLLFALVTFFSNGVFNVIIKSNAIKPRKDQMPEIYQIVENYFWRMQLNKRLQIMHNENTIKPRVIPYSKLRKKELDHSQFMLKLLIY